MNQHQTGFVYVQTNDAELNEVVVYSRRGDGRLERLGSYLTGGKGSGKPHLPSQASVVLADGRLFVTNAGSGDVTVFAVEGDVLTSLDRVPSGGSTPTSLAVHGPWVYVLNSMDGANVTGFSLDGDGRLAALAGSSRALGDGSDPAQVAFSPDGRTLVVTDRAADSIHAFAVGQDGMLAEHASHPSSGMTPYGFDFAPDGTLVVTEAAGAQVGKASASSYRLGDGRELVPVSAAVPSTRSEVCWAVVGAGGRIAFVTNFGDGTISTYELGADGTIRLRDAVAATTVDGGPGIRDEAISSDGRFLYALHADSRQVFAWEVGEDGTLVALGSANGLPATAAGLAAS
jgi:6-phosphogluconolactonase (cycloisomerase 2 family)